MGEFDKLVDEVVGQKASFDSMVDEAFQPKGKLTTALESIDESTVLGQIAGGAARPLAAGISAAAFNIPETVFGEVPPPKSLVETGVTAVARAAGFIGGGPIKLAKFTLGTKLLPTREGIRAVGQMMARAGAELGLASGYSSIAPAIKYAETIPQGLHEVATNVLEGAAVGVTFPLAGAIPNKLLRVAAGVLATDKIRAGVEQGFTIDDTVKSVISWAKGAEVSDEEKQKLIHDLTGTFIDMYFFSKVPELRKTLMALKENRLAKEVLATRVGDMETVIDSLGKGKVATMTEGGAKVEGVQIDQDVANMANAIKTETTKVVDPTVEPFKFDPNSTKNEGRWRLKNPAEFDSDTYFKRKSSTPGISYVMGLNKATGAVEEQAIRFDKRKFNNKSAAKWWEGNKDRFTRTWSWTGKPGSGMMPAPDPSREVDLTTSEGRQAYIDTIEPSKLSLEDTLKDRAAKNQAEIERATAEEKEPAAVEEPTVPEIDVEGLRQEADALEREADDVNRFVFDRQMEGKEPIKTKDIVNIIKEAEPSVLDKISTKGIVNIVDKIRDGDKDVIGAAEMYRRALEGRGPFLDANDKLYLRYVGAELDKIQMIEMPITDKREAELTLVKAIGETKPPKSTKKEKKELLGVPLAKGKPREVKPKEEGPTLEQAPSPPEIETGAEAPNLTKYEVGPTEPAPWMQSALDSIWAAKPAFTRGAPQAAAKALAENVPADGIKEFARSVGVSKYDIAKVDDPLSGVGTEWLANRIINKIITSDNKPELQMVEAEPTPDAEKPYEVPKVVFNEPTMAGDKIPLSELVRRHRKEQLQQDVDYIRDYPKNKLMSGLPESEYFFRVARVFTNYAQEGIQRFAEAAKRFSREFGIPLEERVVEYLKNVWNTAKGWFDTTRSLEDFIDYSYTQDQKIIGDPVSDVEFTDAAKSIKNSLVNWFLGGGKGDITLSFLGGREWKIDPEVKRDLHKIGIYLYRKGLRDVESWKKGFQQLAGPAFNDRLDDIYTTSKGLAVQYELAYDAYKKFGDPDKIFDQRRLDDGTKKLPLTYADIGVLKQFNSAADEQLYRTKAGPMVKALEHLDNMLGTDMAEAASLKKFSKIFDPSIFVFENIDRAFGTPLKTVLLDEMSAVSTNGRRELNELVDFIESYEKQNKIVDYNITRIGAYRLSQREGGAEVLAKMNVKPPTYDELTTAEKGYDKLSTTLYKNLLKRINDVRILIGEEPLPEVENYHTFMRVFLEKVGKKYDLVKIDKSDFIKAMQTPFPFKDAKRSDLPVETDVKHTLLNYSKYALNYIHKTPVLAKAREYLDYTWSEKVPAKEEGKFTTRERGISIDAPNTYELINRWINAQAGVPRAKFLDSRVWDNAARQISRKLGASIMLYNMRVAFIQPFALDAVVGIAGGGHVAEGIRLYATSKAHRAMMEANSNELLTRSPETVVLDALSDIAFAKGTGTFKERVDNLFNTIHQKGWKTTILTDMVTARISWLSGYSKAKADGMPDKQAYRYADDVVIKSQGSAAPHHVADIQRHSFGKILTLFNTFTINRFAWLRNDVLEPIAGKGGGLSNKEAYKTLFRLMIAMAATNVLFEDILKVRSPNPVPIRAFQASMEKDDDVVKAGAAAALELTQLLPVASGLRYGSLLGPVPGFLWDVGRGVSAVGSKDQYTGYIPPWWELVGKYKGVPGIGQVGTVVRAAKRAEKGEDVLPQQYILGRPSYEKR